MATKIHPRSCTKCRLLCYEDDGGEPEYSISWPTCGKEDRYQYLKSFPFKKRMPCFRYDLVVDLYKAFDTEKHPGGVWTERDAIRLRALERVGKVYR